MSQPVWSSEAIDVPDISQLVIEDDRPVDNFQSAKQQRSLVEPLYSAYVLPRPFIADANVGIFFAGKQSPIAPDAFLSLRVQMPEDWRQKRHRTYFVWEFGKVPEVCIEIVSNREGEELGSKKALYAQIGVAYYAVFDPLRQIQEAGQMDGSLLRVWGLTVGRYTEMRSPFWLETVGLGLAVWEGVFEDQPGLWLRWCDRQGEVILTGAEARDQQQQQRADRLAERLRSLGVDPEAV